MNRAQAHRHVHKSPSEAHTHALGVGKRKKKIRGLTTKGNYGHAPSRFEAIKEALWAEMVAQEAAKKAALS